jgi:hypothetical protein
MIVEIEIPMGQWRTEGDKHLEGFVPIWEGSLRRHIEAQPDPLARFTDWLAMTAKGERGMGSARLYFFEQPYLEWAEHVERIIETTERQTRERVAYEIVNPE